MILSSMSALALPTLAGALAGALWWRGKDRDLLSRRLTDLNAPAPPPAPPSPAPTHCWVEREQLLERLGGDVELLGELVELFRYDTPPRLSQLRGALAAGDAAAFSRAAHGIKSGVSNFCVPEVTALLAALENNGRRGSLEGAAAGVEAVTQRIVEVIEELTEMCAESAA